LAAVEGVKKYERYSPFLHVTAVEPTLMVVLVALH
jgi:hypothetical protein